MVEEKRLGRNSMEPPGDVVQILAAAGRQRCCSLVAPRPLVRSQGYPIVWWGVGPALCFSRGCSIFLGKELECLF